MVLCYAMLTQDRLKEGAKLLSRGTLQWIPTSLEVL